MVESRGVGHNIPGPEGGAMKVRMFPYCPAMQCERKEKVDALRGYCQWLRQDGDAEVEDDGTRSIYKEMAGYG
jgi:hypothetical protein